jgi:hypothetical protein
LASVASHPHGLGSDPQAAARCAHEDTRSFNALRTFASMN